MSDGKQKFCKVCKKTNKIVKDFCKKHYNSFKSKNIDINGVPRKELFFDKDFNLKKRKDNLKKFVIESGWYRKWRDAILKRDNKTCNDCNKKNIKVYVHHEKIRFSEILGEAKQISNDIIDQLNYCEKKHTINIGITLCRSCHADKHKGEKFYSALSKKSKGRFCLVCGAEVYCKNFCYYHYGQFRNGVFDEFGNKIRVLNYENKKTKCLLCQDVAKGKNGAAKKFCYFHLNKFYSGYIDINGNVLKKCVRRIIKNRKCKICEEKHSSLGFCQVHYNRYKIGQIDINGHKIRELHVKDGEYVNRKSIEFNGEKLYLNEWAERLGIGRKTLDKRLQRWSLEKALTTPCIVKYKNVK